MRTALITGANKGIGLATARKLVQNGVHVLVGARDERRGRLAVDELRSSGKADLVLLDMDDPASIDRAIDRVSAEFSELDLLINNAGVPGDMQKNGWEFSVGELQATLQTDFLGPYQLAKGLLPVLRANSGRILNMSIPVEPTSSFDPFAYQVAKAPLSVMTKSWGRRFSEQAIPVEIFAYMPGAVTTDLNGNLTGEGVKTAEQAGANIFGLLTDGENHNAQVINWDGTLARFSIGEDV